MENTQSKSDQLQYILHRFLAIEITFPIGPLLLTLFSTTVTKFSEWIDDCIHMKIWGVITYPCPDMNGSLSKPPQKIMAKIT